MAVPDTLLGVVGSNLADAQTADLRRRVYLELDRDDLLCMVHPVGFYHFRLGVEGAISIRLHYWPATNPPLAVAATPYHDHVWELQSYILVGEIGNDLLELADDPDGEFVVAAIEQIGGVDAVVPTEQRVRIACIDSTDYSQDQVYSIKPRHFHCSRVRPGVAALTLVRAAVSVEGGPRTLVPAGYSGQAPERRFLSPFNSAAMRKEIQCLLAPQPDTVAELN